MTDAARIERMADDELADELANAHYRLGQSGTVDGRKLWAELVKQIEAEIRRRVA